MKSVFCIHFPETLNLLAMANTTDEEHEEMESEEGLQTVCIREEREYFSLSSWGGAEDGDERVKERDMKHG